MTGGQYWYGRSFFAFCAVIKGAEKSMWVLGIPKQCSYARFLVHCWVGLAIHHSSVAQLESRHSGVPACGRDVEGFENSA